MSKIKINDEEVSKDEALEILSDDKVMITKAAFFFERDPNKPRPEKSDEGFSIEQDVIAELSRAMTNMNAGLAKYTLKRCPGIMDRTLYVIMTDPGHLPWWKRKFLEML